MGAPCEAPVGAIQQRRRLLDNAPTLGFECTCRRSQL